MSYAQMAAKGPKQSDEEVSPIDLDTYRLSQANNHPRSIPNLLPQPLLNSHNTNNTTPRMPHHIPEIAHSDSGVHSLDSSSFGSSPHISSAPSYADQGLASERAAEAEEEGKQEADEMALEAKEFMQQAETELSRLEKESGKKYDEFSAEAKQGYEKWKQDAGREYEKTKKQAKKSGKEVEKNAKKGAQWTEENKGNPVVIGNAVVMAALAGVLGIGAYRLHSRGELTWKVAGMWAGVVGLFGVGDYYLSQFFFKKYPPKQ